MRALLVGILIAGLVGCGVYDAAPKSTSAKSASEECPGCNECCAAKSRTAMLQKSNATPPATLRPAEELAKEIEAQRGKVVCVFVWGSYHVPSLRKLPDVVELQKKLEKDGVVFLTACHAPPETREMAANLLDRNNCTAPSFIADVEQTIGGETIWDDLGLPGMIVVGRDGKKIATFHTQQEQPGFNLPAIEAAVKSALNDS